MLRFGPAAGPVVVVALPLFEEANRTRAFAVAILRALAERGVAGALPDLPGQGESLIPTHETDLGKLRSAFAAAAAGLGTPAISLGIRSGALLDGEATLAGRYHLSPMNGADLRRELVRARQASSRESGEAFDPASLDTAADSVELAGNLVAPALLAELTDATPLTGIARTVRLETEAKPADSKLPGSPLWRRAEPDNDIAFANTVADDVALWVATCAA
ncbi:hypothetical protein CA223_19465 [Sphingomonas koreensis]|jgi:hypothetical protein|uniref:Alpha/beta hydrolase n=1 Tax=Sphingomonas koreensis TaxID=93064 RepID=A0A1L6JCS3_9SPHN|nr:hypothetical protein [Sphingomonas koreensis]APR53627.1 hypothetical protein BRX40_15425 [Sphingomonas koreensis]MDC7809638.1 hypothetical protein [Sphingomonas koreensis]RSU24245.1 hypothetical protein CA224_00420 [Sphingomonas koreensis]RSU25947.1 hypothetical protein CA222_10750 [Sphingomonas koreensis]RSU25999.1 hypothetical protein CA222_11065 [Sphingomonas koreensis]